MFLETKVTTEAKAQLYCTFFQCDNISHNLNFLKVKQT